MKIQSSIIFLLLILAFSVPTAGNNAYSQSSENGNTLLGVDIDPNGPDEYDFFNSIYMDDTSATRNTISAGVIQYHNFHSPLDVDWCKIAIIQATRVIAITVTNLGEDCDTVLTLFTSKNGELGEKVDILNNPRDNAGKGIDRKEYIEFYPDHIGTYYLKIENYKPADYDPANVEIIPSRMAYELKIEWSEASGLNLPLMVFSSIEPNLIETGSTSDITIGIKNIGPITGYHTKGDLFIYTPGITLEESTQSREYGNIESDAIQTNHESFRLKVPPDFPAGTFIQMLMKVSFILNEEDNDDLRGVSIVQVSLPVTGASVEPTPVPISDPKIEEIYVVTDDGGGILEDDVRSNEPKRGEPIRFTALVINQSLKTMPVEYEVYVDESLLFQSPGSLNLKDTTDPQQIRTEPIRLYIAGSHQIKWKITYSDGSEFIEDSKVIQVQDETFNGMIPQHSYPAPDVVYDFDEDELLLNGWGDIPGGFVNSPGGAAVITNFPVDLFSNSLDQKGIKINVQNNQVHFIYAIKPIQTYGYPVLLKAYLRAKGYQAEIALGAYKGNLLSGESSDRSIATLIPSSAKRFIEQDNIMVVAYDPDQASIITPVFQVASYTEYPVEVNLDRIEVYLLSPQQNLEGLFFDHEIKQE